MPLVSATTDDDFIAEVTGVTAEAEERQRRHTAAMIEEYLRHRAHAAEQAAQLARAEEAARREEGQSALMSAHAATQDELANAREQVGAAATALGTARARETLHLIYGQWRAFVERRQGQRRLAIALEEAQHLHRTYHAYVQWRLLAAARRTQKLNKAKEAENARALAEQQCMMEQLHDRLREEATRNARLEADLKSAFVKGVSALNREAVQALHGEDAARDAEEIEDILTGSRRSTNVSPTAQSQRQTAHTASLPEGVCPVHHRDTTGTYYHPCYAPCSCPHFPGQGARAAQVSDGDGLIAHRRDCPYNSRPSTFPSTGITATVDSSVDSSHSSQHTPFVVRADLSAARSVDTDYPRHPGQKPRWR